MYGNNQYGNPQYQPLQADPTQQTVAAIHIQDGNPPFVPQVQVPGELTNYIGWIVTSLMHEVQGKCMLNPARMYAFNLMATNMWATQEFTNLTQVAVNHIDATMRLNQNASLEQCLTSLIPDLVGKYCLALCAYFPDLIQFLDQNTANHVNNAIAGMQSIANTIAQVQQQMQRGMGGVQQQLINGRLQGTFPSRAVSPHAAAIGGAATGAQRLFDTTGAQNAPTNGVITPVADGTVSRYARQAQKRQQEELDARNNYQATYRPAASPAQQTTNQEETTKVGGFQPINRVRVSKPGFALPNPTTPLGAPPSPAQPAVQTTGQVAVKQVSLNKPEQLVWTPSEAQPYRTVYDFTKFKGEYVKIADDVIQVIKPLTSEEVDQMNIDDHALTRPPLPRYDATGIDKPEEPLTDATPVVPVFELEFHGSSLLELSTGITSTITGLRYAISKANTNKAAAKCYPAVMVEPISVEEPERAAKHREYIERIGSCTTFEQAVKILDEIYDSAEDRLFFNRINRLLTQELNNVLMMNFTKFWMDDFYADVMSIPPAIGKARGQAVLQSFLGKQHLFFQQFVMAISADDLVKNTEFMVQEYIQNKDENPSGWEGGFVILPWLTSFTHLNLPSYELNIGLKPGETGTLSEEHTKELWSLADQILNNEDTKDARRHYIVTQDGVQFLLARGYIKEDAYLLRRIREVA